MKLIIAIIQDEYNQNVVRALIDAKIRATKLSSTGGFLKDGNTTLLIGVEDKNLDHVVDLIRSACDASDPKKKRNADLDQKKANLFIIDIDSSERI